MLRYHREVTRHRFPPALGIIGVLTAVHSLLGLSPMIAMLAREGSGLEGMIALLAGASIAQLAAGIAIATSWAHARVAVLAWTLLSIASVMVARDLIAQDARTSTLVLIYIEALAGPALAWLALAFASEHVPSPAIPQARVVSTLVEGAGASSDLLAPSTSAARSTSVERAPLDVTPDVAARRPRVGVVLVGLAIMGLLGVLVWRVPTLMLIARGDNAAGVLAAEVISIGHGIAVALVALRAARRLLDPHVAPRAARTAVQLYLLIDVGGDLLRFGLQVGYQLVAGNLEDDRMRAVFVHWTTSAVVGLVIPVFVWFYLAPALRSLASEPAHDAPALAAVPAWAMLWFAPFLLGRVLLVEVVEDGVLAPAIRSIVVATCAILGVLHLVAGIRAIQTRGESATRVARIAATIALVIACALVLVWVVVTFAMDPFERLRTPLPTVPLVQLVACSATLVWALGRRR